MSTVGMAQPGGAPRMPVPVASLEYARPETSDWHEGWNADVIATRELERQLQEQGEDAFQLVFRTELSPPGQPGRGIIRVYRREAWNAYLNEAMRWQHFALQAANTPWPALGGAIPLTASQMQSLQGAFSTPGIVKAPEEVPEDTTMLKLANRFKVGCDPEFAVLDRNGNLITTRIGGRHEQLGSDHSGRVVELRPTAAKSTYTLLRRLKTLLDAPALEPFRKYRWKAGAIASRHPMLLTLGGHVHLDTLQFTKKKYWGDQMISVLDEIKNAQLADTLDRVTLNLERLDLLPRAEAVERRRGGNYGTLGDWRTSPGSEQGGVEDHFEYRTMSSWLYSPATTMISLTAAKLAAIDPALTMDVLPQKGASFERLVRFFEAFKGKDADADRVLEKLVEAPRKVLRPDETADFKERWKVLPC